ncbi:MAG TPA: hypothetical protein VMU32_11380 [Solirubrobacteraceae bacterium]|nr:hypothetical protein [Solirubrobacteraceae bacterium]
MRMQRFAVTASIALAVALLGAPSAGAAGWMVGGSELSGSEALATTAKVTENYKLTSAGVTVECSGNTVNSTSPELLSPDKASASSIIFTHCEPLGGECTIPRSELGTVPIELEATLEGSKEVRAVIKPKTGKIFASIQYEGSKCALAGVKTIKGKATAIKPTEQQERTLQESVLDTGSGELEIGNVEATLKGKALHKLASSKTWSFL